MEPVNFFACIGGWRSPPPPCRCWVAPERVTQASSPRGGRPPAPQLTQPWARGDAAPAAASRACGGPGCCAVTPLLSGPTGTRRSAGQESPGLAGPREDRLGWRPAPCLSASPAGRPGQCGARAGKSGRAVRPGPSRLTAGTAQDGGSPLAGGGRLLTGLSRQPPHPSGGVNGGSSGHSPGAACLAQDPQASCRNHCCLWGPLRGVPSPLLTLCPLRPTPGPAQGLWANALELTLE